MKVFLRSRSVGMVTVRPVMLIGAFWTMGTLSIVISPPLPVTVRYPGTSPWCRQT